MTKISTCGSCEKLLGSSSRLSGTKTFSDAAKACEEESNSADCFPAKIFPTDMDLIKRYLENKG